MRNRIQQARRARRGITIVEVTLYVSLSALLLGTLGTALHSLSRANRLVEQRRDTIRTLSRFGQTFRTDVRGSSQATFRAEAPMRLTLRTDNSDSSITYEFQPEGIRRTVQDEEGREQRERFRLPSDTRYRLAGPSATSLVTLTVDFIPTRPAVRPPSLEGSDEPSAPSTDYRTVVVQAAVPVDHAWQAAAESAPPKPAAEPGAPSPDEASAPPDPEDAADRRAREVVGG